MVILVAATAGKAQSTGDTLIIEVGKSKLMFIVNDVNDIEKIRNYDLNKIMQRLQGSYDQDSVIVLSLADVEQAATSSPDAPDSLRTPEEPAVTRVETEVMEINIDRFKHYVLIEFGMNNYLENGSTPSSNAAYNVRPWGSWYFAIGSLNRFRISRGFMIDGFINVSWYNFKFQQDDTYVLRGDEQVEFVSNPEALDASFDKSKLTVAYLNAALVPMVNLGKKGGKNGLLLGAGMYAGYRIGSYMKVKYDDGNTEKKKNHDPFYLNDFRYGVRFQAGLGDDVKVFVNYDLNELFREGRGPELNAFSFGIVF